MKIRFCGAAQGVTGSQFLLSASGSTVLVDCGLFQGRRAESQQRNANFLYEPGQVNAVLITHAHMDHAGNIPSLVKKGFGGKVHATAATAELCQIMLKDSATLQERDVHWVNKVRARHNEPPVQALYSRLDAEVAMGHFQAQDYGKSFSPAPGFKVTFRNAGHIIGSTGIQIEVTEKGRTQTLGVAVDVGRPNMPVEDDPDAVRDVDSLIMESTYGNRLHTAIGDVDEELAQIILGVTKAGGKIIVPSFAVGRTQTLIYLLHKLHNQNRIPELPIYVDSPMALEATEVYRRHTENLDRATHRLFLDHGEDPFGFNRLKYVRDVAESKALNGLAFPHIIISSSGMCEGGRVLHHLRNNIENPKCVVLFVGYAAKNTLARKLVDGDTSVKIFGEPFNVRCQIKVMDAFSAHADRRNLLDYVKMTPPAKLKNIFLVHGEEDQALPLRDGIRSMGYQNVQYPAAGETVEI
jgi:metallo-beta-lactamase family protein